MRTRHVLAVFVLIVVLYRLVVHAQDNQVTLPGVMAIAKMAGACGILDSQLTFQKTTKMAGGDEFIVRYWAAEAARLGVTMKKYSETCDTAITAYGRVVSVGH